MLTAVKMIQNIRSLQKFISFSRKVYGQSFPLNIRTFHSQKYLCSNYEGDGKTIIQVLNRENKQFVMIDSISEYGFRLNNNIFVVGPIAIFAKSVLQWNVKTFHDITPESLSLFFLLEPKIDILLIGTGDTQQKLSKEVLKVLHSKKISHEILKTEHACATFNFLNVERRCVAAAILPPEHVYISYEELHIMGSNENLEVADLSLNPGPELPGERELREHPERDIRLNPGRKFPWER